MSLTNKQMLDFLDAVEELIDACVECDRLESVFPCPEDKVSELIGDFVIYHNKMQVAYSRRRVALAKCQAAGS